MKSDSHDQKAQKDSKMGPADGEHVIGYTKEEYSLISSKKNLPARCPILRKCFRAVLTRFKMGHECGGSPMTMEEFLHSQGLCQGDVDGLIRPIRLVSCERSDILTSVSYVCPEVTLFEPDYLPLKFRQSAFSDAIYYKETGSREVDAAHYSECAEFAEYQFQMGMTKTNATQKTRKRSHISNLMRFEIFQRDSFRCHYCRRDQTELPNGVHLDLDHKVPYVDGGEDSFENLVTACSECNNGKANKVLKQP